MCMASTLEAICGSNFQTVEKAVGDLQAFDQEVGAMINYIYASTPADGVDRVRLPGDPEKESTAHRKQHGIEIDPNSWESVLNSAEYAGLDRDKVVAMAQITHA